MNAAHWHLILNHIPPLGMLAACILWIIATSFKSKDIYYLALGFLVVLGIVTIPVYFTGLHSIRIVAQIPGISFTYIGHHAQWAQYTLESALAVALFALVTMGWLFYSKKNLPWVWNLAIFLAILAVSTVSTYTAMLGGQIRHTEVRFSTPSTQAKP